MGRQDIGKLTAGFAGVSSLLITIGPIALAWFGGKPLLRGAEQGFWSLNALAVQPVYALCREGLRHLIGRLIPGAGPRRRAHLYAAAAIGGGVLVSALSFWFVQLAWPATRWIGEAGDVLAPQGLVLPALANAVVIIGCYVMGAALVWAFADGALGRPVDLMTFVDVPSESRTWHYNGGQHVVCGRPSLARLQPEPLLPCHEGEIGR